MTKDDPIVLVIDWWDEGVSLPRVVGPFSDAAEAAEWAGRNVPNGTAEMHALTYPYLRPKVTTP